MGPIFSFRFEPLKLPLRWLLGMCQLFISSFKWKIDLYNNFIVLVLDAFFDFRVFSNPILTVSFVPFLDVDCLVIGLFSMWAALARMAVFFYTSCNVFFTLNFVSSLLFLASDWGNIHVGTQFFLFSLPVFLKKWPWLFFLSFSIPPLFQHGIEASCKEHIFN